MLINRWMKALPFTIMFLLLILASALLTGTVSAHSSLVQTIPEPNSQLQEAPDVVSITFNERLDQGLYYLKVLDQQGDAVTKQAATMNADKTGLELKIPKLGEGIYVISYHVISADGHPVDGSYPMTIGNPPQSGNTPLPSNLTHQHDGVKGMDTATLLQYLSRGLWYATMLALTGWVLWLRLPGSGGIRGEAYLTKWTSNLQRVHLVALLLLIFTHVEDLLGEGGLSDAGQLFTGTSIGISWLLLLLLTIIGFVVLQKSVWLDIAWALALLAVESFNGHAISFSPQIASVVLDFIHLAAAALWVGGLLLLAVQWRNKANQMGTLLQAFSRMALISIIILSLTGTASLLIFLPSLNYLFYTQWGIMMLVKIGLVLLVIGTGVCLRVAMKKQRESHLRGWFKVDFGLMIAIVLLVGLITYMAPLPPNEPLRWHVMGETAHMTAEITPKAQGSNTFITKVWLPETAGPPKQVLMLLHYENDKHIAPLEVPLELFEDQAAGEAFGGFIQYSYKAVGAYLPLRGEWSLEVRVMDANDNEKPYKKEFMVY